MILRGDCLEVMRTLEAGSVQTCVTSPPYFGLRDYGVEGQIGLEETPEAFVAKMVEVFREVRRLLRDDGTLWLNLGDSYAANRGSQPPRKSGNAFDNESALLPAGNGVPHGLKPKDLVGIPWRVAFALQSDGWYLRQDIIWYKRNPMPESVRDRCTKAHEYLFLLTKSPRYYYDADAIKEPAAYSNEVMYAGTSSGLHSGESHAGSGKSTRRFAKGVAGWGVGRNNAIEHNVPGRKTHAEVVKAESREIEGEGTIMRNKRSVWDVPTRPFPEAHFATFPEDLVVPCILAGSRAGDLVLDPFMGAGTTAVVASKLGRRYVGAELNPEYADMADARLRGTPPGLALA